MRRSLPVLLLLVLSMTGVIPSDGKGQPFLDRRPLHRSRSVGAARPALPNNLPSVNCSWPHPVDKCRCNGSDVVMQFPPGDAPLWAPKIYQNENYDQSMYEAVMSGIKAARQHVGSMGPVSIFFWDKQPPWDVKRYSAIARAFCYTLERKNSSHCFDGLSMIKSAVLGEQQAENTDRSYGQYGNDPCPDGYPDEYTDYLEEPLIVFVNQIGSDLAYFATRGTHEYTHTFQAAYLPNISPAWLAEGSAEYNAYHEGARANVTGGPTRARDYPGYLGEEDDPVTFWWSMVTFSLEQQIQQSWLKKAPGLKLQEALVLYNC